MAREPACHVHGAERMDKAAVFGRGIDPAGTLELIDVAETLHPGRVNQVLFRPFMRIRIGIGNGERDVLVDWISDERRAVIGSVGWMIGWLHTDAALILAHPIVRRQWFDRLNRMRLTILADEVKG